MGSISETSKMPPSREEPARCISIEHLEHGDVHPNPEDPMNWSWAKKHSILACVSLLGGLGTYGGLFIVPA